MDTVLFAVNFIRAWWSEMGKEGYPDTDSLLIAVDGGRSDKNHNKLWKTELQKFADESQLDIRICHFPPGTYKWHKFEYRLFSQFTRIRSGLPPETLEIIVNLIAPAPTDKGPAAKWEADTSDSSGSEFYPDWNYTIYASGHTC